MTGTIPPLPQSFCGVRREIFPFFCVI